MVFSHHSRLLGLESREGASVAEARATRDDMRGLRMEIGGWFKSLIDHIMETRADTASVRAEIKEMSAKLDAVLAKVGP